MGRNRERKMHLHVDHVGYGVSDLTKMAAPGDVGDRRSCFRKETVAEHFRCC